MGSNKKPLIEKKILYAGTKNINFTNGTKVYFHYQTRLCDAEKTTLDDSRKLGDGRPMELVLGKKFKLEVWETIVQMMSLNEVAQFTVDKSLVPQYPFVAKTLRDVHKPKEERNRHCCGMMLQNEGVGYQDLNNLLKYPQNLEFTIELVKVESPEEYSKESWQLTEDEKLNMVPVLKEKGNVAFKNCDYTSAEQYYSTAIGYLEQLSLKEKPHDEDWLALQKQKIPLLLNFSQCKLLEGDFYTVIEHCTTVLNLEPDNVKALFRRAKAHLGAWNPESSKKDFLRAAELDPSLEKIVQKHLKELDEQIKTKAEQDKQKLKALFN